MKFSVKDFFVNDVSISANKHQFVHIHLKEPLTSDTGVGLVVKILFPTKIDLFAFGVVEYV